MEKGGHLQLWHHVRTSHLLTLTCIRLWEIIYTKVPPRNSELPITSTSSDELNALLDILKLCTATEPEKRPSFQEVFKMLSVIAHKDSLTTLAIEGCDENEEQEQPQTPMVAEQQVIVRNRSKTWGEAEEGPRPPTPSSTRHRSVGKSLVWKRKFIYAVQLTWWRTESCRIGAVAT